MSCTCCVVCTKSLLRWWSCGLLPSSWLAYRIMHSATTLSRNWIPSGRRSIKEQAQSSDWVFFFLKTRRLSSVWTESFLYLSVIKPHNRENGEMRIRNKVVTIQAPKEKIPLIIAPTPWIILRAAKENSSLIKAISSRMPTIHTTTSTSWDNIYLPFLVKEERLRGLSSLCNYFRLIL